MRYRSPDPSTKMPPRTQTMKAPEPSGISTPGHHHASSRRAVSAPASTAARMRSPVLAPLGPIVHAARPGVPLAARNSALLSMPPAARRTPRSARMRRISPAVVTASTPTTRPSSTMRRRAAVPVRRSAWPVPRNARTKRPMSARPPIRVSSGCDRPARSTSGSGRISSRRSPISELGRSRGLIARPASILPGAR